MIEQINIHSYTIPKYEASKKFSNIYTCLFKDIWFPDDNLWTKSQIEARCILWISKSSLIMTIFRQFLPNLYAPFCTSNMQNVWFPDDNLWAKIQMCCMPFRHFLLKLFRIYFQYLNLLSNLGVGDLSAFYFSLISSYDQVN